MENRSNRAREVRNLSIFLITVGILLLIGQFFLPLQITLLSFLMKIKLYLLVGLLSVVSGIIMLVISRIAGTRGKS